MRSDSWQRLHVVPHLARWSRPRRASRCCAPRGSRCRSGASVIPFAGRLAVHACRHILRLLRVALAAGFQQLREMRWRIFPNRGRNTSWRAVAVRAGRRRHRCRHRMARPCTLAPKLADCFLMAPRAVHLSRRLFIVRVFCRQIAMTLAALVLAVHRGRAVFSRPRKSRPRPPSFSMVRSLSLWHSRQCLVRNELLRRSAQPPRAAATTHSIASSGRRVDREIRTRRMLAIAFMADAWLGFNEPGGVTIA